MEEGELKSSLDIALSRFASKERENEPLDEQARASIKEFRSECEAKVAECKIMTESEIRRLASTRAEDAWTKMERLREELSEKIRALEADRDRKIETVRRKASS